ncbi:MAG: thiamine-phosphate kinase [Bacteroidaceae bacterium]|nr:thiamine-phosphate kinase [Bacteroidaceae bacterium]
MEIAELGEFGLIRRLTEDIKIENGSTIRGVGDDCAVLQYTGERRVLVTTDLLMEGVHFDLQYVPLEHLGYKSIMVNLSDVYAMNGTPRQVTVSLALSKRFRVEDVEALYRGMRLACERHHVDLVGGDTTSSLTGLAISVTAIGEARPRDIVYRDGARATDLICVSGNLGAAYMGLQLMEREKSVFNTQVEELRRQMAEAKRTNDEARLSALSTQLAQLDFQPDWSGREYLLERQLKPEARRDIVEALREAGIQPTAMMDISDGLSSELMHICTQSHTGCRVYEERIPLDYQTAVMAEELNMNVTTCALNGGEDYELLFTVPLTMNERVSQLEDVKVIGYITEPQLGCALITRDGQEFELKAQGWNPLKRGQDGER